MTPGGKQLYIKMDTGSRAAGHCTFFFLFFSENTAFIAGRQSRRMGGSCSKDLTSFVFRFQGKVFKGSIRSEGCRVPDQVMDILLIDW